MKSVYSFVFFILLPNSAGGGGAVLAFTLPNNGGGGVSTVLTGVLECMLLLNATGFNILLPVALDLITSLLKHTPTLSYFDILQSII